jgi:hypothetical protein
MTVNPLTSQRDVPHHATDNPAVRNPLHQRARVHGPLTRDETTNPARCGGGGQGLSSTQTLIRPGTRITPEINLSSNCAGTYHGTVLYQPSLGPAGQEDGRASRLSAGRQACGR